MFPNGTRWFFDHAETVRPRSLERIAALGGAISVQNRTMFQAQPFVDRYGHAAAQTSPPIRATLDTGLTAEAGSDAARAASYNPELGVAGASMSPGLAAMTDRAAAAEPFAKAAGLLEDLAGVHLTAKRVERSAEASGSAKAAADRDRAKAITALRCREASGQWEAVCRAPHNQTGAA
jgi:hypothetical protein